MEKTITKVLHRAGSRGYADHGWLKTYHTFSFAGYYEPSRMHFGELRVLNDDIIKAGSGFGLHPHDNMEIITIPLKGSVEHRDSMGSVSVINPGDIQVMSAGTGLMHSESNHSNKDDLNLLQIWIFPKVRNVEPRYDQKTIKKEELKNNFHTVISPERKNGGLWLNQDTWFSLGHFDKAITIDYPLHHPTNGIYLFVIEGKAEAGNEVLEKRDGIGLAGPESFSIRIPGPAYLLLMEVPMH